MSAGPSDLFPIPSARLPTLCIVTHRPLVIGCVKIQITFQPRGFEATTHILVEREEKRLRYREGCEEMPSPPTDSPANPTECKRKLRNSTAPLRGRKEQQQRERPHFTRLRRDGGSVYGRD